MKKLRFLGVRYAGYDAVEDEEISVVTKDEIIVSDEFAAHVMHDFEKDWKVLPMKEAKSENEEKFEEEKKEVVKDIEFVNIKFLGIPNIKDTYSGADCETGNLIEDVKAKQIIEVSKKCAEKLMESFPGEWELIKTSDLETQMPDPKETIQKDFPDGAPSKDWEDDQLRAYIKEKKGKAAPGNAKSGKLLEIALNL